MSRAISLAALVLVCGTANAREAVIAVAEVEVRSGPSTHYYATGLLRAGEKVEVRGEKNGYLEIAPPPGSFSLIRKQDVERKPGGIDLVARDGVETLAGSTLVDRNDVRGTTLGRGALVTIIGEAGDYYQIEPANESRYVLASAIETPEKDGTAFGPPPSPVSPPAPPHHREPRQLDQTGDPAIDQAEAAYRRKEWNTAERLFAALAKSNDYQVRIYAQNRLEFIRQLRSTPSDPVRLRGAAETAVPPAELPKAKSIYTFTSDRGSRNPPPSPQLTEPKLVPPLVARQPSPAPIQPEPSAAKPVSDQKKPVAVFQPVSKAEFAMPGRLRKAYVTDAGRPLYYLEDSAGRMRAYFAPQQGLDPTPFLNQLVEVRGEQKAYRGDLRGDYFRAVGIDRLAGAE